MTHKECIALADMIKAQIAREVAYPGSVQRPFTYGQICDLADFCKSQSKTFHRAHWMNYIGGRCDAKGNAIKAK
jgi:hypothetical protein